MPIITKPATIEKNQAATVTLNKTLLASLPAVSGDSYFSDSSNWKQVTIKYKSSSGNQKEMLRFDATESPSTAIFLVSDKARNEFQVQEIVITDFDNGTLKIPRSALSVADFDVTLSGGGGGGGLAFQFSSNYEVLTPALNPTYLENQDDNPYAVPSKAISTTSVGAITSGSSNFDITFNLSNFSTLDNGVGAGTSVGVYCTNTPPESINLSVINSDPQYSSTIQGFFYGNYPGIWTSIFAYGKSSYGAVGSYNASSNPITAFRIKHVGTQIEYYINGNLIYTRSSASGDVLGLGNSSASYLYAYPYIYSTSRHTVESVVIN